MPSYRGVIGMCFGFDKYFSKAKSFAPLPLRIVVGLVFLIHGIEKLFIITPNVLAVNIALTGIKLSLFVAWIVSLLEFFGGLLLFVGFATRYAAFFLGIESIFVLVFKWDSIGFGKALEPNFVMIATLITLLFLGAGSWGIDIEPKQNREPTAKERLIEKKVKAIPKKAPKKAVTPKKSVARAKHGRKKK